MHDIRAIRETPELYEKAWAAKGLSGVTQQIIELDAELRATQSVMQTLQAQRNELSKRVGEAKARKDDAEAEALMASVNRVRADTKEYADTEGEIGAKLRELVSSLPNIPDADVPQGTGEEGNVEVRRWGVPFAIREPKDHVDLGERWGLLDFEAAARMSGARFSVLKGDLARLERALGQFMLDIQTIEHGYLEVSPPLLVRENALFGTGQLPKFKADLFRTVFTDTELIERQTRAPLVSSVLSFVTDLRPSFWSEYAEATKDMNVEDRHAWMDSMVHSILIEDPVGYSNAYRSGEDSIRPLEQELWLIPTAEVSLTNLVRGQILSEEHVPQRFTALTPCFRSEAGASGRDTRGIVRQHQFYKVELVSIVDPVNSDEEHERMVGCAEAVLKRLELPFRTMLLCTGDMGFSARKTYDLEVWLPSQGKYREISSISNCGDFQARRMNARSKKAGEKGTRFVHTLNGSGLAVGRTLVAIMENYQDEDGRIAIPQALHSYMPGVTHIGGKA